MNYSELLELLHTLVSRCGSQKAAADRIGVGLTTLNRTLRRKIAPKKKLLTGLGLGMYGYVHYVGGGKYKAEDTYPVVDRMRYDHVMEVK